MSTSDQDLCHLEFTRGLACEVGEEVAVALHTDIERGLDSADAAEKLSRNGRNELAPPKSRSALAILVTVRATLVPMPVGSARSYMEILDGNNICTSVFLLFCAALLFAVSRAAREPVANRVITLTGLVLAGVSALSFRYFFPVPGVFTGLAGARGVGPLPHQVCVPSGNRR